VIERVGGKGLLRSSLVLTTAVAESGGGRSRRQVKYNKESTRTQQQEGRKKVASPETEDYSIDKTERVHIQRINKVDGRISSGKFAAKKVKKEDCGVTEKFAGQRKIFKEILLMIKTETCGTTPNLKGGGNQGHRGKLYKNGEKRLLKKVR